VGRRLRRTAQRLAEGFAAITERAFALAAFVIPLAEPDMPRIPDMLCTKLTVQQLRFDGL